MFVIDWHQFGTTTIIICIIFAVIGALVTDVIMGNRGPRHIVNYAICLGGAVLANIVFILIGVDVGKEILRAILASSVGMTVSYLIMLAVWR